MNGMKKIFCTAVPVGSALLGAAYTADLFLNTNPETGFLLSGSVFVRYLLALIFILCAVLAGHTVQKDAHMKQGRGFYLGMAAVSCVSTAYTAFTFLRMLTGDAVRRGHHWDRSRILLQNTADGVRGVLFLVFAVWAIMVISGRAKCESSGMFALGTLGSTAFYLHTVVRFLEQPSSLYRIGPTAEIFSALAALLFSVSLVRAVCRPDAPGAGRSVVCTGLAAFLVCTCIGMPQAVWQLAKGAVSPVPFLLSAVLGLTGVLGAVCACSTVFTKE